jgi:hypothetical protein
MFPQILFRNDCDRSAINRLFDIKITVGTQTANRKEKGPRNDPPTVGYQAGNDRIILSGR